jgi:hypothetical protein
MVKVQIDHCAVIATNGTATTRLLDERPLHTLMPSRYRLAYAALAADPAVSVLVIDGRAVAGADALERRAARCRRAAGAWHERGVGVAFQHERMFARVADATSAPGGTRTLNLNA